jgi:hypothetical protein
VVLTRLGDSDGPMLGTNMGIKLGSKNNIGGWLVAGSSVG